MKYVVHVVVLLVALCLLPIEQAEAKRRLPKFMAIPGLGRSEEIVKVIDLPDIAELRRSDGVYVDLGYLFHTGSGGEWVGYIGSTTKYVKLDEASLASLLEAGGVEALPPVPSRPAGGWFSIFVAAGLAAVYALYKWLRSRGGSQRRQASSDARRRAPAEDDADDKFDADAVIKAHLAKADRTQAPARPAARSRPAAAPATARATFGRRGA